MADNNKPTPSELLFEELCREQGIQCNRLQAGTTRQPDYELNFDGQRVVVEVKQTVPNTDDKAHATAIEQNKLVVQSREPKVDAARVRNAINKSRKQFNSYFQTVGSEIPAILVVFDSTSQVEGLKFYTRPYTIQTALHGLERVVIELPKCGGTPVVVERGFGRRNNKELRPDKNQHLSALVTLHEYWDINPPHERHLALCFYHNQYASCPFDPAWWSSERVAHFELEEKRTGHFKDWKQVISSSGTGYGE